MNEVELMINYPTLCVIEKKQQIIVIAGQLVGNQNDSRYQNSENSAESRRTKCGDKKLLFSVFLIESLLSLCYTLTKILSMLSWFDRNRSPT